MVYNMSTILEGAEIGQTYYIEVYAVNAVGNGVLNTEHITLTAGDHFHIVALSQEMIHKCNLTAVPVPTSTTTSTPADTGSEIHSVTSETYSTKGNSCHHDSHSHY